MEMLGKVRRMYYRDGLSRSEISRRTGLSRNTVKKWLKAAEGASPAYRRESTPGKLGPYQATLIQALEADARRPRRDRRSAKALLAELRGLGYTGGYTVLTDFIRGWRLGVGANALSRAFVPLKFALGEAFQFDWSEEGLMIGGVWRKLLVAHLKLCASRAFVLVAYPSQGHEMLFDAHTRSFAALGGIPRRGIYDNMKTAVDKGQEGQGPGGQCPLCGDVLALPVRRRFLQCRVGLGKGRRREERAGQPAAHLARSGPLALWQLRRTEHLAAGPLPGPMAGNPSSRVRVVGGRDA